MIDYATGSDSCNRFRYDYARTGDEWLAILFAFGASTAAEDEKDEKVTSMELFELYTKKVFLKNVENKFDNKRNRTFANGS